MMTHLVDPITKADVAIYTVSNNGCGAIRCNATWKYLNDIFKWQGNIYFFKDYDEAINHWSKYVVSVKIHEAFDHWKKKETMANIVITPLLIDKKRMLIKLKCPSCNGIHIFAPMYNWGDLPQVTNWSCPKTASKFSINLWEDNRKNPSARLGDIPFAPKYNCKECWASGELVLFTSITQCKCCIE